jgi:hypothetical protein
MSSDWVNRIGIILNFCAGVLLAPELIGIQRLQRFEKFLEGSMPGFRDFVEGLPRRVLGLLELGLPWLLSLPFGSRTLWNIFLVILYYRFDLAVRVIAAMAVSSVAVPLVAFCVSSLMLRRMPGRRLAPSSIPTARPRSRDGLWERVILDVAPSSIPRPRSGGGLWDVIIVIALISFFILFLELGFLLIPLMILGAVCWVLSYVGARLLSWVL